MDQSIEQFTLYNKTLYHVNTQKDTITKLNGSRGTAYSSRRIVYNRSTSNNEMPKHYWILKVENFTIGSLCVIGIHNANLAKVNCELYEAINYGYKSSGKILVSHSWKKAGPVYRKGDVVEVALDLNARTVSFSVNDSQAEMTYKIPAKYAAYCLAVHMQTKGDSVTILSYQHSPSNDKNDLYEASESMNRETFHHYDNTIYETSNTFSGQMLTKTQHAAGAPAYGFNTISYHGRKLRCDKDPFEFDKDVISNTMSLPIQNKGVRIELEYLKRQNKSLTVLLNNALSESEEATFSNRKLKIELNRIHNKLEKSEKMNGALKSQLDELNGVMNKINKLNMQQLNTLEHRLQNSMSTVQKARNRLIEQTFNCVVCMENRRNVVTNGCNHCVLCNECEMKLASKACPICKASYSITKKIKF